MNVVVVIPARGGSKGIPRKNLQEVGGLSLVARSVRTALAADVALVCVTTDSQGIADAAREAGALIHHERPETAGDTVLNDVAVLECLDEIDGKWSVVVMLQPTAPFTEPEDIDGCVALVRGGYDSAFAGCRSRGFLWRRSPLSAAGINHEATTRQRRQDRPPEWLEAGSVYAMRADGFKEHRFRFFGSVGIHEVPARRVFEIDTPGELQLARRLCPTEPRPGEVVYVDIDGTICQTAGTDPRMAVPIPEQVARFNRLHDMGCHVVYWTARGTLTGLDWSVLTKKQLSAWGCRYDAVEFGKPFYDRFYDDRAEVA